MRGRPPATISTAEASADTPNAPGDAPTTAAQYLPRSRSVHNLPHSERVVLELASDTIINSALFDDPFPENAANLRMITTAWDDACRELQMDVEMSRIAWQEVRLHWRLFDIS